MHVSIRTLMLASIVALASQAQADNILSCPGFETTADSGWWYHKAADSVGSITIVDSTAAHTGSFGMKAVITKTSPNLWDAQVGIPRNWVANLGSTYTLTFWAKADSQRTLTVNTQKKHGYSDAGPALYAELDTVWKQFTLPDFVIADTSDTGNGTNGVQVSLNFGNVLGTFYFDDFDLEETPVDAGIKLNSHTAMRTTLLGRELSLSGLDGSSVRLLDARGHLSLTSDVVAGSARLTLPSRGLWIVESGRSHRIVTAP